MIKKIKLRRGEFVLYSFANLSIDELVQRHIKNNTITDEELEIYNSLPNKEDDIKDLKSLY